MNPSNIISVNCNDKVFYGQETLQENLLLTLLLMELLSTTSMLLKYSNGTWELQSTTPAMKNIRDEIYNKEAVAPHPSWGNNLSAWTQMLYTNSFGMKGFGFETVVPQQS